MPISGKTGTVTYVLVPGGGTVSLPANNWKIDDTADALDTTHFLTGGMQDNVDSIRRGSYTISGPVLGSTGTTPTVLPAPGIVATVALGSGGITWGTDFVLITKVGTKLSVDGHYEYELSGKSTTIDDA